MAVTEKGKGTMTEEEGQKSPEAEVKTPDSESKVSPEEEPRIYTQKQADALVHAARSEMGRNIKDIETERDNLKSQIGIKESELEDVQSERESLEKQIEDLSSGDPQRFDLIKKDKDLRQRERKLKADRSTLEAEQEEYRGTIEVASETMREIDIWNIASEYENGDATKLKDLCDGFDAWSEEQIRKIADSIWSKKAEEEEGKKRAPKPYSGKSEGGSPYFTREQISDRKFWEENRDEILKAQAEGRIKD